jgi:hypothetical protein
MKEVSCKIHLIITLEGEDPSASWAKIAQSMPPEFAEFALDVHGLDVSSPPPPMPTLVLDTEA